MATKDTPIGEHTLASAGNNVEFSDQDDYDDDDVDVDGVFDAILWSDTPDDDYLKQLMMIEDGSKNKNKNKQDEKENASNNRADCDDDDDDDAEPPQNLGRTSSLERIFGYNKKGGRSNSRSNSKRIVAENGRDGSESSHSNQRKSRNKNEKHDDDDDDDDHRTVDELIEASEREEEMELNIILESGVSSSSRSLDAIPNPLPAAKTSTKNIRSHPTSVASEPITHALAQNQEQQHHQKQVLRETETTPLASPPNLHSTSTAGTGTMIWNDDHDSLAGDETVGNIVARMMLEDDEDGDGNTVSDSGLDTTNNECTSSFGSNGMIDTNGMMMAHGRGSGRGSGSGSRHVHDYDNNEGAVAGTQPQFVTDETSVGSIRDEIELIIARHQRDVVGEQQQHHEEDATLGGHQTLVSTLSADYDDPHCARVRAMLGGAPRHPNTPSEGGECREEAIIDKNKHRRGSRYTWWGQGKTKRRPQQLRRQQQQAPKTPSRSVDDTPSPQNSVMKTKDPPGTPSTVLITRHPLGLATPPPSDRDPYEDSNIDSSFSESDEDAHQYGDYDYDDDDDDDENTKQDPRHWGPYACFATGERHIRFYKWIMFGIALLLVLFVALVIALVFELGRRSPGHSPPPTTEPSLAKEDSPIIPEPIGDWVSNSNSNPALPAEEDEQNNLAVPETTLAPTVLLPDKALDVEDRLREIVGARLPDRLVHFDDFKSPQYRALEWMKSAHPGLAEIDEGDRWKLVQKYVLAVFYYATNGMEWETNTGWLTAGTNECDWFSTSSSGDLSVCDDAGKFAEIDLRLNNLQGTIPSELVLIADQLISITVNGNSLSGTIPSILVSELTNLIRFHVHWNFLSGSIPSEVGEMSSLTSLRLAKNKLVGSIPWQLSHLSNLKTLDAMSNGLSGGIPFLLGDLTALTSLNLSNNNISGDIPVEISNLIGLSTLILDRTDLEGTMPDEVCSKLTALETAEVDCEKVACWCCEGCK